MNIFDVGNYIAEQAQTLPQAHIVEGIPFDLLSLGLDEDLLEKVKAGESYKDMVFLAADSGRVADNKHLSKRIKGIWEKEELHLDTEPCMKERVGLIVCEISGLTELIEEQRGLDAELKKEKDDRAAEAKKHLKGEDENLDFGDHSVPATIDVDELNKTADEYRISA